MKKLLLMGMLALGCTYGAKAQSPNVAYANHTTYTLECQFFGDIPPTSCTNAYATVRYAMPSGPVPSSASASSMSWFGGPATAVNGIRLIYMVSGVPFSSVDVPYCTPSSSAPIPVSFPGGPSLTLSIGYDPVGLTYSFMVD